MSKKYKDNAKFRSIRGEHTNEAVHTTGRLRVAPIIIVILCVLIPLVAAVRLSRTALFTYWPGAAQNTDGVSWTSQSGPHPVFGGPYYQLKRGSYIADFQLKLSKPSATPFVRIEIIAHSNSAPATFTREVRLEEVQDSQFAKYSLSFDLTRQSVLETRLFSYGKVDGLARVIRVRPADHPEPVESRTFYIAIGCAVLVYTWLLMGGIRRRVSRATILGTHLSFIAVLTILAGGVISLDWQFGAVMGLWVAFVVFAGTVLLLLYRTLSPEIYRLLLLGDAVISVLALSFLIGSRLDGNGAGCFILSICASKTALAVVGLCLSSGPRQIRVMAVIGCYTFGSLWYWYNQYPLSGDQWSYVLETVSLLRHGSINTFEALQHGDHREFARDLPVAVFLNDSLTLKGQPGYPTRDLGLSMFLTPAYALGRIPLARLQMAVSAMFLTALLFKLLIQSGFSKRATSFSCAAILFSLPILTFSQVFYPELIGALLTLCGFALIRTQPTVRSMVMLGLIVALLPFFNARYWVIAGTLMLVGVFRREVFQDKRMLGPLLGTAGVLVVATIILNFTVYGLALPNAGYVYLTRGANPNIYNTAIPAFTGDFYIGILGIIFDKNWGLIATAPVFILALVGFVALWKHNNELCIQLTVVCGLYFVAVGGTRLWRGGPTPTPRFLVPILPMLALPLAAVIGSCRSHILKIAAYVLTAVGMLTSLTSLTSLDADYVPARLAARMRDAYGFSITSVLPSFDQNSTETLWLMSVWALTVAGLGWWVSNTARNLKDPMPVIKDPVKSSTATRR